MIREDSDKEKTAESAEESTRIVGLSTALANADDLADWMGIDLKSPVGLYNFRPSVRPVPMVVHIQGFPGRHYCPRMATMNKPCYAAITEYSPNKPIIIFVASRRQTRLTAMDLINYASGDDNPHSFLGVNSDFEEMESVAQTLTDAALRHTLTFGIGLHHAGLSSQDRDVVEKMFLAGDIQVLVATATLAWGVNLPAHLVIVKGTEYFDGKTHRYVDYPVTDVLQMMGRAGRPQFDKEGVAVIMVEETKRNFYKKFLYEPFPLESCFKEKMCESINAEIASGTIQSLSDTVGYLSWTFFARRVKENPTYYGALSGSDEDVRSLLLDTAKGALKMLQGSESIKHDQSFGLGNSEFGVTATILGRASSKFYLSHKTPQQMRNGIHNLRKKIWRAIELSIKEKNENKIAPSATDSYLPKNVVEAGIAEILWILSDNHEFDEMPVRHNEEILNGELCKIVPWGINVPTVDTGRKGTMNSEENLGDPHVKCFLLLQAHLFRCELPISDYINDTRSVIDQVPRLLAAMQFIAEDDKHSVGGSLDVICLFAKVRQVLSTYHTPMDIDPLNQIPGVVLKKGKQISKQNLKTLQNLREMRYSDLNAYLRDVMRVSKKSLPLATNFLMKLSLVSIQNLSVNSKLSKSTEGTVCTVKFDLCGEHNGGSRNNSSQQDLSLLVILGTSQSHTVLAMKNIFMRHSKSFKRLVEFKFDWKFSKNESDFIILRVVRDDVRGMDIDVPVNINT
mmetsp:Transcript_45500/g.88876  ORF Transcript_45500/g.88876 Transcript_45500/m.88876 type:complete len:737 (-) Transcript_45500:102-2312(-)